MRTALTIAGSDSSGGAGVQADLKAFAAHHVHGVCAITAVTAQNTVGITTVETISPEVVTAQIESVLDDFDV
ncbi:MAG: bifunctional hydroxymethylpyrimidine kinase/phosphomethylpyrimidine kinase, partial [Vicinamibacterales bacterium]|nr:bifunctional hydroxymethylpyrimidine kinase/phosphomethylpyrimidine kinase [Vicinamibacterales bacterium]